MNNNDDEIQFNISENLQKSSEILKKTLYNAIIFSKHSNNNNSQNIGLSDKYLSFIDIIYKHALEIIENQTNNNMDNNEIGEFPENVLEQLEGFYNVLHHDINNTILNIDIIPIRNFIKTNFHTNPFTQNVVY